METKLIDSSVEVLRSSQPCLRTAPLGIRAELPIRQESEIGAQNSCNHVVTGTIKAVTRQGEPIVELGAKYSGGPLMARTVAPVGENDISRQAVIMFDEGDPMRPIVLGLLYEADDSEKQVNVELDGEKLVLTGRREIVLRCGGASITLTRAGKVLIRGEYVLTRSKGVNRIKGGSVQIN
jgi:hypothetical protein